MTFSSPSAMSKGNVPVAPEQRYYKSAQSSGQLFPVMIELCATAQLQRGAIHEGFTMDFRWSGRSGFWVSVLGFGADMFERKRDQARSNRFA